MSSPSDETASSSSYEWYSVYSGPRLLDTQTSPSSSFITPPDTCEFSSSPFSISKHLDASSPIFEMQVGSFPSLGSVGHSDHSSPSSGYVLKTPLGSISSLSSITASTQFSTKMTPQKQGCPPTCFCRLECDSFGKPRCIDVEQLLQIRSSEDATAKGVDEPNVCRMLVPRSVWNRFRVDNHRQKESNLDTLVAYRGQSEAGVLITMANEDLWADEKNPFLLTSFDLAEN
jgi:hypothetical protein